MELTIQKFLRNPMSEANDPNGIQYLQDHYGVYAKQHPNLPNLYQFAYDQIEAKDKKNPIVRECRGIILDSTDNWKVIAYPFNRFANYGEEWADEIDWNSARVQEKVDGSLCILYFYGGLWRVATRGSANAAGTVGDNPITFSELFWKTFNKQFPLMTENVFNIAKVSWPKDYTWMFELTSPMNRVVVDHKGDSLTFLGARDRHTFEEFPSSFYPELNPVKEFPLTSFEACIEAVEWLKPTEQEGYVVVDKNYHRVKIKSPSYVALHHIRDAFGPRRVIELIKNGQTEEVLSYFPEYVETFKAYQQKFFNLIYEHESGYESVMLELAQMECESNTPHTQKDFALLALKYTCPGALFAFRKGQVKSIKDFFYQMSEDKILEYIGENKTKVYKGATLVLMARDVEVK